MRLTGTFKTVLKQIVPPIIPLLVRKATEGQNQDKLFRGEAVYFKQRLSFSRCYGEYGCGASTIWVSKNTTIPIYAVDTSEEWIENVHRQTASRANIELRYVNLGALGDWGRPLSYANRRSILNYVAGIWEGPEKPDTVLIDGRFRVACFLKSLLEAAPGTCIIFDDYVGRLHFHLVEEFVKPSQYCADQAIFFVPEILDRQLIEQELVRFLYVMD